MQIKDDYYHLSCANVCTTHTLDVVSLYRELVLIHVYITRLV